MNRETRKFVFLLFMIMFHLGVCIYLITIAKAWYIYIGVFIELLFLIKNITDIKKTFE